MTRSPVSSIRNLGPAMETACTRAGIDSAEALRDLGADAAYARLVATGTRPHFIGYYVLHMALQGRPWNDCKGAEKTALRARFDALMANTRPAADHLPASLSDALDRIGVVARKSR
ncbi:TfoX/Sxy family protein [Roseivivax sp. CAU 1753]